jgi:hypothetical protein
MKHYLKSTKATQWTLLTFTWVAFLLRTLNLAGQSLWRDEVDAIRFSNWPLAELATGLFRVGTTASVFLLLHSGAIWRASLNLPCAIHRPYSAFWRYPWVLAWPASWV